jgi:hypothetical protein
VEERSDCGSTEISVFFVKEVCTYLPGKGKVLFQLIKKGQRYDQGHNGMGNLHDGVPVDIR